MTGGKTAVLGGAAVPEPASGPINLVQAKEGSLAVVWLRQKIAEKTGEVRSGSGGDGPPVLQTTPSQPAPAGTHRFCGAEHEHCPRRPRDERLAARRNRRTSAAVVYREFSVRVRVAGRAPCRAQHSDRSHRERRVSVSRFSFPWVTLGGELRSRLRHPTPYTGLGPP